MQNNVFIVGNGFDLALGLPTKYSNFAHSDFWPISHDAEITQLHHRQKGYMGLEEYLNGKKDLDTWFDLEQELYNYARQKKFGAEITSEEDKDEIRRNVSYFKLLHSIIQNENKDDVKRNIKYYKLLQKRMCEYIKRVQNDFGNFHYDVARDVLKAVVDNGFFNSMYSFNYTELPPIPGHDSIDCFHLHGRVKDYTAILGVDEKPLREGYEDLMKTSSKFYKSHDLYNALAFANEVVIFGVSFGDIDYSYFDRFFKGIVNKESIKEKDKQYITIFTKDDNSRMAILRQLRKMEIDMQRLYAQSKLQIICTQDEDIQDKVNVFKERLEKNSAKKNPQYHVI